MKKKSVLIILLVFAIVYSIFIFSSDFGVPDVFDYNSNYPCNTGINQFEGGFVFENCYVLKLPEKVISVFTESNS